MTAFKTEDDLYRYVGGIFEAAFADPDLGPRLTSTGLVLGVRCTEPDCALVIDTVNNKVYGYAADAPLDAEMAMTAETANRYWQGKVSLPVALARGQIKIEGSLGLLLKLAPLSSRLFPLYLERLRADGREDLIVS
ncbi:SCP2 sterol-binding domain-containing protein [Nocardia sp. NPDC059246]|uniref:SCP2 sterol-binding domain-containing protein n=1 Tax=unclassified Nocardia TaxID=2637762 RepID=UPI0036B88E3F